MSSAADHNINPVGCRSLMLAATMTAVLASAAGADQALVVGIDNYPGLKITTLGGCVNDAADMSAALQGYGFQVTTLTEAQASREAILGALARLQKSVGTGERFVFYFAGHGTKSQGRGAVLMPGDARESAEANDISAEELNAAVAAVPARSRTVLLDSSFSGGLLRSVQRLTRPGRPVRTRYYARGPASRDATAPVKATREDSNEQLTNGSAGRICYFVASRGNEQAGVDQFEGKQHGVFTHFLLQQLRGDKAPWGDVQAKVSGDVATHMDDLQHPTISPAFVNVPIFDAPVMPAANTDGGPEKAHEVNPPKNDMGPSQDGDTAPHHHDGVEPKKHDDGAPIPAPKPPPPHPAPAVQEVPAVQEAPPPVSPQNLWDQFNADHVDRSKVEVTMNPNETTLKVMQQVTFAAKVGSPGYLVILERGTSGNINLLFPSSRQAADARVEKAVTIPEEGYSFAPDAPGTERVRAILFESQESAAALLGKFPATGSITVAELSRSLLTAPATRAVYYTSDIIFEVIP